MKFTYGCLIFFGLLLLNITVCAQSSLSGKVVAVEINEELIGAVVKVYKDDALIDSLSTDIDGNYKINIDPGTYDIEVSYVGFSKYRKTEILLCCGQNLYVDFSIKESTDEIIVEKYQIPEILDRRYTYDCVLCRQYVRKLPCKSIPELKTDVNSVEKIFYENFKRIRK